MEPLIFVTYEDLSDCVPFFLLKATFVVDEKIFSIYLLRVISILFHIHLRMYVIVNIIA